mmetsp:Transcript_113210/g.283433  ORF Transcript_113210/g.283433 Transcript_113210/m.283433 type:complete len:218 (-) Transcript_113210:485-1138(-)
MLSNRNCRHQRGVQATAEQDAVWHVSHQTLFNGLLERLAQGVQPMALLDLFGPLICNRRLTLCRIAARAGTVPPSRIEVPHRLDPFRTHLRGQVVPWREDLKVGAIVMDRFEFRGHEELTTPSCPVVQWRNTNRISSHVIVPRALLADDERENPIQALSKPVSDLLVQMSQGLAIGLRAESGDNVRAQLLAQLHMVVDLTVYGRADLAGGVEQWLLA